MARWRVTAKHYLNAKQFGEDTTWVREETNRDTGRAFRRTFMVPLLIDPEDPICINRNVGYCVVATEGSEMPGDIILLSPCTPDMEPLDEEARQITAQESKKWKDPINGLPIHVGEDFGNQLLAMLTAQMNSVDAGKSVSLKGASNDEVTQLKTMLAQQQEQINRLLAGALVVPAGEPLPDINETPATPPVKVPASSIRRM
jgi:hypothetical protein